MFLEVNNISKAYTGHVALNDVSLSVPEGSVYGLLGPNGAGKSTLIRIINRIIAPDSGEVTMRGNRMTDEDVRHIGYLPEERGLYKKMKVGEQIVYLARLKGMSRRDAVTAMRQWLRRFDLGEWENRRMEALSKGMQQKVQFIVTAIHRPQLLIFDEPFSGFDPLNADLLKDEILRLRGEGATVLFSTHNMQSVEALCDQFSLINRSRVVLQGAIDEVKQQFKENIFAVQTPDTIAAEPNMFDVIATADGTTTIRLAEGTELRDVINLLNSRYDLRGITEVLPTMNEIFIKSVKQSDEPQ